MKQKNKLHNQTIVVTGASKGIGRELAIKLASNNVVIAIARETEALKELEEKYAIETIIADLSDRQQVQTVAATIRPPWPMLSALINNVLLILPNAETSLIKAAALNVSNKLDVFYLEILTWRNHAGEN